MPHRTDHVIHQFRAPIGTPPADHTERPDGRHVRVWHVCLALLLVGFIAGKAF